MTGIILNGVGRFSLLTFCAARVAALLSFSAGAALSQTTTTDELSNLRADFERLSGAAVRTLDEKHRLHLQQMEQARAEVGDYEGAAQIKQRLEALAQAVTTAPIIAKPSSYVLLSARAALREGALLDSSRGVIEFRRAGSKATWELLNIEPGVYEVRITYATGLPDYSARTRETVDSSGANASIPLPGGVLGFGEYSGTSATASGTQLQKRITTTGSWSNFVTETMGRYNFRMRSPSIRLEAISAATSGLMHLKQVELVKTSAGDENLTEMERQPTSNGAALDARLAMENLRERHRAAERAALSRVRLRFSGELDRLERDFASRGESAAAVQVARERATLFQEKNPLEESSSPSPLFR